MVLPEEVVVVVKVVLLQYSASNLFIRPVMNMFESPSDELLPPQCSTEESERETVRTVCALHCIAIPAHTEKWVHEGTTGWVMLNSPLGTLLPFSRVFSFFAFCSLLLPHTFCAQ